MLDEIVLKASIKFPWSLTLGQSKELVKYIALKLPADITYFSFNKVSIEHSDRGEGLNETEKRAKLRGSISHKTRRLKFIPFQLDYSGADSAKLSGLSFILSPGWNLGEKRSEEADLWDDVRKVVADYFANGA